MHAVGSSGVTHVAGRGRRSSCRWVVADLRAGHYVRSEEGQEAVAGGKPRDIEAALLPRLPDVIAARQGAPGIFSSYTYEIIPQPEPPDQPTNPHVYCMHCACSTHPFYRLCAARGRPPPPAPVRLCVCTISRIDAVRARASPIRCTECG